MYMCMLVRMYLYLYTYMYMQKNAYTFQKVDILVPWPACLRIKLRMVEVAGVLKAHR